MDPHGSTPDTHTHSLWSGHSLGSLLPPSGLGPPFLTSSFLPSLLAEASPSAHSLLFPSIHSSVHPLSVCPACHIYPQNFQAFFLLLIYSNFSYPNPLGHQRAPLPASTPTCADGKHRMGLPAPSLSPRVFSGTLLWVRGWAQHRAISLLDPSYLCCVTVTSWRRLGSSWEPRATIRASGGGHGVPSSTGFPAPPEQL